MVDARAMRFETVTYGWDQKIRSTANTRRSAIFRCTDNLAGPWICQPRLGAVNPNRSTLNSIWVTAHSAAPAISAGDL
jgi:hypothetical protein